MKKQKKLKLIAFVAVLSVCGFLMLAVNEPDEYTPGTFLYERQSRLVADYIDKVLRRGDAALFTESLKTIHAELKTGQHDSELDVIEVNLSTIIATAEDLIRSQDTRDRLPFSFEEMPDRGEAAFEELKAEALAGDDVEIEDTGEEEYTPPEHDSVYNEAKKDLLDEAYDMLETLESRKNP